MKECAKLNKVDMCENGCINVVELSDLPLKLTRISICRLKFWPGYLKRGMTHMNDKIEPSPVGLDSV